MVGRDLFKVESNADLSHNKFKSLVLFYSPLIGAEALALYEFLVVKGSSSSFEEVSKLLNSLNISIDKFEDQVSKLNEYKLVKTLKDKDEDRYIFIIDNPLDIEAFIKDDIFVRDFIHKTSGEYYQSLLINIRINAKHEEFIDISKKIDPRILDNWTEKDETFLRNRSNKIDYNFNTFFNVNEFLKDVSVSLLPLRFRSEENMKELATLADLYNVSIDRMRTFLPRVARSDSNEFDLNLLRYLCENSQAEYRIIEKGIYDVPCELFLMNKQDGKEVTKYDKKIIYSLGHDYHLNPSVINVLLEHGLSNCDNRLIEKYLYAIASDLNRNNIKTSKDALDRLSKYEGKTNFQRKEAKPDYSKSNNIRIDSNELNELIARRNG